LFGRLLGSETERRTGFLLGGYISCGAMVGNDFLGRAEPTLRQRVVDIDCTWLTSPMALGNAGSLGSHKMRFDPEPSSSTTIALLT